MLLRPEEDKKSVLQCLKIFILLTIFLFSAWPAAAAPARGTAQALQSYSRGEALAKQGKMAAALGEFDRAVKLAPENLGMRARLAWLLLDQNQPQKALPHFDYLVSHGPAKQDIISGLAITYLKLGRTDQAVAVLDKGLVYFPGEPLLLKLKGEALGSRGETAAAAVAFYDELLKRQPGKPEWVQLRQAAALKAASYSYDQAQALLKQGQRAAALKAFEKAIRFNPQAAGYRTHYGWTLLEDGQAAAAARTFQEVLGLDPQKEDAYLGLALAQMRLGDPAAALQTADKGLELFPEDVKLLEVKAGAASARPETRPLAEETYRKLLALRPDDYRTELKLAQIAFGQGRLNEAERRYLGVLRQDPGNLEANLDLGRMNLWADAYGQSKHYFERAVATSPENQPAAQGLQKVKDLMRPQFQTHGGVLEDSETFRRYYIYSSGEYFLTDELRTSLGYGYLSYNMNNNPFQGRTREHDVHRNIIPIDLNYRPSRQLVLQLGGAFSDYGVWGQSGAGRAGLYYQATADTGLALSYAYYDVIDYYGPFKGPWGQHVNEFADSSRYRYLIIDPTAMWTQNIFGASSTQAITDHIRAHDISFWGYQNLFSRLTFSLYGSASPYNDGNFRENLGTTVSARLLTDPLLKVKYSFFYLGFRDHSIERAHLPAGSAPLYWDPIAFKNHAWGVVFEQNWLERFKVALEADLLYNPGAPTPGALVFLEFDVLLTKNLAWRTVGFYLNSSDKDRTSYQVRSINTGLSFRF